VVRLGKLKKLPAIAADIDGVMIRGGKTTGDSPTAVRSLLRPTESGETLPFVLLTNNGVMLEKKKAELVSNTVFGEGSHMIDAKRMIQA